MIPRPHRTEVLAQIQVYAPDMTLRQIRKFITFLAACEYIGNGKYVVTVLNQGFGKNDPNLYPRIFV